MYAAAPKICMNVRTETVRNGVNTLRKRPVLRSGILSQVLFSLPSSDRRNPLGHTQRYEPSKLTHLPGVGQMPSSKHSFMSENENYSYLIEGHIIKVELEEKLKEIGMQGYF